MVRHATRKNMLEDVKVEKGTRS